MAVTFPTMMAVLDGRPTDWSRRRSCTSTPYSGTGNLVDTMAVGRRYCDRALTASPPHAAEFASDPEKRA